MDGTYRRHRIDCIGQWKGGYTRDAGISECLQHPDRGIGKIANSGNTTESGNTAKLGEEKL